MIAQLLRLDGPDGVIRLSTLPFDWTDPEGATWVRGAHVLELSPRGPAQSEGGAISVRWNGYDAALIAEASKPGILRAKFRLCTVEIDDVTRARVGTEFDPWVGLCETPEINADPANGSITIVVNSPLLDMARPRRVLLQGAEYAESWDPDA